MHTLRTRCSFCKWSFSTFFGRLKYECKTHPQCSYDNMTFEFFLKWHHHWGKMFVCGTVRPVHPTSQVSQARKVNQYNMPSKPKSQLLKINNITIVRTSFCMTSKYVIDALAKTTQLHTKINEGKHVLSCLCHVILSIDWKRKMSQHSKFFGKKCY